MVKRIGRRFVSLLLTFVTILTMLPAMTLPALAATSGTVTGLADENIGLSFTGDADNAWSANGTSITGAATSKGGTCSDTSYQSTLTITNKRSTTATLSFDYSIEQNVGKFQVDGTEVSSGASFTKELAANESIKVYIKSGSTSAPTKITLTNVVLVSKVNATATFVPAKNGTYTVDGKLITEKYSKTQSSMTAYQVVATPADGYQFMGWYDVSNEKYISTSAKAALNVESDCTITARFASKTAALFETSGQRFDDLGDAVTYAQTNHQTKITLATDGSISGNYIIPAGITLLIPFDAAGTLYTDAPAAIRTTPASKAFRTLTMSEGTSITVNGVISLGGRYFAAGGGQQGRPVGDYGYIKMADNSSITVKNGGKLYAWGFISGSGSVLAESGATVYEFYQIADFRGGSASTNMGNVFPFSQYFVQNIEVPLTLNAGANEQVYSGVYAMSTTYTTAINFIGDNGMFKVESGSFTKDYDEKTDRLVFTVNGEAALNTLSLKLAGMSVNSASYVLPITNNITINIQSGNVTINQDAALLAGVEVNIAEGAGLTVANGKNIYFYDSDEWNSDNFVWGPCKFKSVAYAPGKAYNRSTNDLVDAKMDVNGSVTAIGAIYTTKGGADICSSNKTGKYVQQGKPGTGTATHQYNAKGKSKEIPITAAKLHNLDNSYTETSKTVAQAGDTFTYCKGQECGSGKWVKNLKVAAIGITEYDTLQKAVTKFLQESSSNTYIKMLHSTTENIPTGDVTTNKDIYLDLNGCTVKGDFDMGAYKLYGMDSTAGKDYVTAPSGKIVGTVKGCAPTYQTPTENEEYDRYVAIQGTEADGNTPNLSFHHFNISVSGYRFELATGDTPQCALFFIGKFQGDDAAKAYLKSLGFKLKDINDKITNPRYEIPAGTKIPPESNPGNSPVVLSDDGAYFFEAYLMREIDKSNPNTYQKPFSATAQAIFGTNVGTQNSETKEWSFQEAWQNALTDPDMDISPAEKKILEKFLEDLNIPIPNPNPKTE